MQGEKKSFALLSVAAITACILGFAPPNAQCQEATVSEGVGAVVDEALSVAEEAVSIGLDEARRGLGIAEEELRGVKESLGARAIVFPGLIRDGSRMLVVPSRTIDEGELSATLEDVKVMSRILDRALVENLGSDYTTRHLSLFWDLAQGPPAPEAMYLQEYGAVFVVRVKFPLLASVTGEKSETAGSADSVWERTKREIHGLPGSAGPAGQKPQYDAAKMETLQMTVLRTLKHATNIRHLAPDESVVVAVVGGESPGSTGRTHAVPTPAGELPTGGRGYPGSFLARPAILLHPSPATVLTIHVRKSDIDAFARDEITFDKFCRQATIYAY